MLILFANLVFYQSYSMSKLFERILLSCRHCFLLCNFIFSPRQASCRPSLFVYFFSPFWMRLTNDSRALKPSILYYLLFFCTSQQLPQRGGAVPNPVGLVEMAVSLSEGPSYPGHSHQTIFSSCCPLNDRRRAARSFSKIGRLSSPFCLFHARLFLLILLVLMSSNVNPNPGPIYPCSVCAGILTWWDGSVQCCTCSKWVHLRCSLLSLSKFRTLSSSHSWSCPSAGSLLVTL